MIKIPKPSTTTTKIAAAVAVGIFLFAAFQPAIVLSDTYGKCGDEARNGGAAAIMAVVGIFLSLFTGNSALINWPFGVAATAGNVLFLIHGLLMISGRKNNKAFPIIHGVCVFGMILLGAISPSSEVSQGVCRTLAGFWWWTAAHLLMLAAVSARYPWSDLGKNRALE